MKNTFPNNASNSVRMLPALVVVAPAQFGLTFVWTDFSKLRAPQHLASAAVNVCCSSTLD